MKKYLILFMLTSFIIPNTFYTNNNYTGIVTKKGEANFGMHFSFSNIESYFNQNTIDDYNEYQLANGEIEDLRRSQVFKSVNLEYMTKFGLEIGISGGTTNNDYDGDGISDGYTIKNLSLGYHFKGNDDKTNGFITVRKVQFSPPASVAAYDEDSMDGIALGIYSGKGFWFKLENVRFEEDEAIDQMYNNDAIERISSIYFMSFGQVWNKKGFVVGLSYTSPLNTNETDGLENNDKLKDVIMQGDISFNIGFSI